MTMRMTDVGVEQNIVSVTDVTFVMRMTMGLTFNGWSIGRFKQTKLW